MNRILVSLFVVLLLLPAAAAAQAPAQTDPFAPAGPPFRAQVAQLDKTETAVSWSLQVRLEGAVWIIGGGATIAATLIAGAVDLLSANGSAGKGSPYIAGFGVPLGLSILLQGLPQMLGSSRYLHYLVDNGVPLTNIGRLRLIHDWRVDLIRMRRDTMLVGSAFLGAMTILSAVVWGVRDGRGVNSSGTNYDPADMFTTMCFFGASGASGISALVAHLAYQRETTTPHRLYARVSAGAAPVISRDGVGVQASMTVSF